MLSADKEMVVSQVGAMLLVAGAPLALGAVHRPTILTLACIAAVAVTALWDARRQRRMALAVPWYGVILLAVTAYTALQMVPLPIEFLRYISPHTVEILGVSLGSVPGWHPISLDPPATFWEVIKIGTCALTFILVHNLAWRPSRRRMLLLALVVAAIAVFFLGAFGAAVVPGKSLMVYTPRLVLVPRGLIASSFVNPNHGAAFFYVTALLAMGLALGARTRDHRVAIVAAAVLLACGALLTLSRGGLVALAVGLVVLGSGLLFLRDMQRKRPSLSVLVPLVTGMTLAIAGPLVLGPLITDFQSLRAPDAVDWDKLALWPPGWEMLTHHLWVGIGRGAFLTAFPRYLSGGVPFDHTYSHLENEYLHLPIEWGVVVGGAVLVASALVIVLGLWRKPRSAERMACAAALAALAAQAWVDFNLELLGMALPAVALLAILSAGDDLPRPRRSVAARMGSALGVVAAVGLFAFAVVGMAGGPQPTVEEDTRDLQRAASNGFEAEIVLAQVNRAVRRHPADYLLHLVGAEQSLRLSPERALPWLNRAMFLFPNGPQVHLLTARTWRALNYRAQAMLAYRLALEKGARIDDVLPEGLAICQSAEDVARLLPEQPRAHLRALRDLLQGTNDRRRWALSLGRTAHERWPDELGIHLAFVRALVAFGPAAEAWHAAEALAATSPTPASFTQWAKAARRHNPPREMTILTQARKRFPANEHLTLSLARAHQRQGDLQRARALAHEALRTATTATVRTQAQQLLATLRTRP